MTARAIAQAGFEGAEVDVIALAAVRATREAQVRGEGGSLPVDHRPAGARRKRAGGETFDGADRGRGLPRRSSGRRRRAVRRPTRRPFAASTAAMPQRHRLPLRALSAAATGADRRRHAGIAPHSPRPRDAIPVRRSVAMTEPFRKPAAFSADDPRVLVAEPEISPRDSADNALDGRRQPDRGGDRHAAPGAGAGARCSGRPAPGWCCSALGLAVTQLRRGIVRAHAWLGALGLALAASPGSRCSRWCCARSSAWFGSAPSRTLRNRAAGGDRERRPRRKAAPSSPICWR